MDILDQNIAEAKKVSQDKDVKSRDGTQPKKYFDKKGDDKLAKSTKQDRARHFEKGAKKDDDDSSAYEPAPGDAQAKTKPSKHTKKFKKMFGEDAVAAARLKANQADEQDRQKDKHEREVEKLKQKHEKENEKQKAEDEKEKENELMQKQREAQREEVELEEEGAADKSLKKKADKTGISVGILKQVYKRGVAAWRTGHRPGTTPEQWGHARVNSFITKGEGTWGKADKDLADKVRGESIEERYADKLRDRTKSQQKAHQKAMMKIARKSIKDYDKRNKKEEIDEDFMSFLAFQALPAFMVVNAAAFIGLIAFEMAEIDIIGKTEKAIENIKSKFKRNKNYKPSKSELETLKKVGQEVKKKDPSAYKKAEAKAKSMKEEIDEGKLVTSYHDIIDLIQGKIKKKIEKEYEKSTEKGLKLINDLGAMIGHKATDKKQEKGKLFLKFGEEMMPGKGNVSDDGVCELGTDDIRKKYQADTPGQSEEAYIKETEKAFHEQQNRAKKNFKDVFGNPLKGYPANEEFEVLDK